MNPNRSLRQAKGRQRETRHGGRSAQQRPTAKLPRVVSSAIFFASVSCGILPGVYAQTTLPTGYKSTQKPKPIAKYVMPHTHVNPSVVVKNPGPTPLDVEAYRQNLRVAPFGRVPFAAYLNAIIQRGRMPATAVKGSSGGGGLSSSSFARVPLANSPGAAGFVRAESASRVNIGDSTGVWFPFGPYRRFPAGATDQGQIPVAGRVSGIDYAKDSSGIFYIATASGGLWKWDPNNTDGLNSTNSTVDVNWTHFSDSQFATPETSCVTVDPNDHRIVYVGMGDFDGNGSQGDTQGQTYGVGYGLGIMKSVNGGATWYNIGNGNPLAASPGFGTGAGTQPNIMEGTAVSAIVVNPTNSKNIIASCGRGVNSGAIWYSNDSGNTWTKATIAGGGTISGDWSSLDVSNVDGKSGDLVYYATRENDGVYESATGTVWTKLPVPLVFNGTGFGGQLGLKVIASKLQWNSSLTTKQRVVYVMDGSGTSNDGRIFKSVDGGYTWTDITGSYPYIAGDANTWSMASFAFAGISQYAPVEGDGSNLNPLRNLLIDQLTISTRRQAVSTGPIEPTGPTGPLYAAPPGGGAVTEVAAPGATPDFEEDVNYIVNQANFPNKDFHGYETDPSSLLQWEAGNLTYVNGMSVSDGGIYQTQTFQGYYELSTDLSYLYYNSPETQFVVPGSIQSTMNDNLVIAQFLNVDFLENGDNISIRGSTINNTIAATDTAEPPSAISSPAVYPLTYMPTWSSIDDLTNPTGEADPAWALVSYAATVATEMASDSDGDVFTTSTNPDGISDGAEPPIDVSEYPTMDNISFNPLDTTGSTQVMATSGGNGQWLYGAKRIYYTDANWQSTPTTSGTGSLDITPDQQQYIGEDGALIYIYNTEDPQDGVTGPDWEADYHPNFGMPFAWDLAPQVDQNLPQWEDVGGTIEEVSITTETGTTAPCLYTGGTYLWRFDPPGSDLYPPQPGPQPPQPTSPPFPVAPSSTIYWPFTVGPNQDHGLWRKMGTQALSAGTDADHISAIGVVPGTGTVYVGTTAGNLWVTTDDNGLLGADYQIDGLTQLPPLAPTWYQIAGAGLAQNSLPSRPITSISVNPSNHSDILVTLGGAAGAGGTSNGVTVPGRIYRCTNATGSLPGAPVFVNTSGTISTTTYAYLPDVTTYSVARDTDDPFNTFYAATDVGVFATIDGGSTWTNATTPLGLPNVAATGVKVLVDSNSGVKTLVVGTYGRGAWGFDLTNISPTIYKPNLVFGTTFNRTGNVVVVNLKITNQAPTDGTSFGTAYNVSLNSAALLGQTGLSLATAYTNLANPTGSLVASNPISVGTIGQNQTAYVTLYFPGSSIRSGTLADLKISGTYTLPPIPPGTTSSYTSTSALTHLP